MCYLKLARLLIVSERPPLPALETTTAEGLALYNPERKTANAFHHRLNGVTWRHCTNAGRGASEDQIASLQRIVGRQFSDNLFHRPDHFGQVTLLTQLSID